MLELVYQFPTLSGVKEYEHLDSRLTWGNAIIKFDYIPDAVVVYVISNLYHRAVEFQKEDAEKLDRIGQYIREAGIQ